MCVAILSCDCFSSGSFLLGYLQPTTAAYFLHLQISLLWFLRYIGALCGTRGHTSRDFLLCRQQPIVRDCPSSLISCKNTKDRAREGVVEKRVSFPLSAASPFTLHREEKINTRGETSKLQ